MYVKTNGPAAPAGGGLGFVGGQGFNAFDPVAPTDPGAILDNTVAQSKDRLGKAALFGLAILGGVGWLMTRSGRR